MTKEELAESLNKKFPCPGNHRGKITGWQSNKLCSMRHKKDVPIYHCTKVNGDCSIEPYASGQPEQCCKRCDVFWQHDTLRLQQIGVRKPPDPQAKLKTCVCGRKFEGPAEWTACGKFKCINPRNR